MPASRRRIAAARRGLLLSSALIGVGALPQIGWAQAVLPLPLRVEDLRSDAPAPVLSNGGRDITYDLGSKNRIFRYTSFDIATGNTVTFSNTADTTTRFSVINQVLVPTRASQINGTLRTASSNITAWLINREGITFGAGSSFSGGSLVLSTLPLLPSQEAAFLSGTLAAPQLKAEESLIGTQLATGTISLSGTADLRATGSFIAVAEQINASQSIISTGGSVALIAATDVTFTNGIDNPLSFVINQGTRLGTVDAASISASGTITGQSIRIVGGAQTAATAGLLGININAGANLTATATNGTIVIATANTSTSTGPAAAPITSSVTVTNAAGRTPGIAVAGRVSATGTGGDVVLNGAGGVTVSGGTLAANRNASLTAANALTVNGATQAGNNATYIAGGALTVGGAVTAGGEYRATGGTTVTLGRAATAVTQTAGGLVTITAQNGAITGTGDLTLAAGTANNGALTLDAVNGAVAFGAPAADTLLGGTVLRAGRLASDGSFADRADIAVRSNGNVTLGSVTARALTSLAAAAPQLSVTGDYVSGAIDVTRPLTVSATGAIDVRGSVTVSQTVAAAAPATSVRLDAAGVTVRGAIKSDGGDILVTSTQSIALTGAATTLGTTDPTGGTIALLADGSITQTGALTAGEDVAVRAVTSATIGAVAAGDDAVFNVGGTLSLSSVTLRTTGGPPDRRAVVFDDPATPGVRIGFGAETAALTGYVISATANALTSATALTGSRERDVDNNGTDDGPLQGLVVESITRGGSTIGITANTGDIRVGAINAGTADTTITATAGSVTGVRTNWVTTAGGSTLVTPGRVTLDVATAATIGSITAGGLVSNTAGLADIRVGDITAGAVDLRATDRLQLGDVDVTGTLTLLTTAGTRLAPTSLTAPTLVSGYQRAGTGLDGAGSVGLVGGATLTVRAANGVALLGSIAAAQVSVEAAALDVTRAESTGTTLALTANTGRLTLGSGNAKTTATLWKRGSTGIASANDALFVTDTATGLVAGTGADVRSVTDLTIQAATATTGNLRVQATGNATLNTGAASAGTLALLGGTGVNSSTLLSARQDVAVRAGVDFAQPSGGVGNVTLGQVRAGDDIDLFARGTLTLGDATSGPTAGFGTVPTGGSVTFNQALAGQGNPFLDVTPNGGIAIVATEPAALDGNRIRIRAGAIDGRVGTDLVVDSGLIVRDLTAGVTTLTAGVAAGGTTTRDIRLGTVTASGDVTVTAANGSVSGLLPGWSTGASGARLTTTGDVTLDTTGPVALGAIITNGSIGATGTLASVRIGSVQGSSVDLAASGDLQIDTVAVGTGLARLQTIGGTTAGFDPVGTTGNPALPGLVAGHGAANLTTTALLTVEALQGAAQLGTIRGSAIGVAADAVDIASAKADVGNLTIRAERGRLTLGTGDAAGDATLWKRNDAPLVAAGSTNGLFVTDTNVGLIADRITIRSTADATVRKATTRDGDLLVSATGKATLDNGAAATTLAVVAGGTITSNLTLTAGEDVALGAGGDVTLRADGSVRHVVSAGDDVDVTAGGTVFVTEAVARGTGSDAREVRFTPGAAGTGDPAVAGTGGIALVDGATLPAAARLAGSSIRLTAGAVTGPGVGTPSDDGLVIGRLDAGDAVIDAASGDIRIRDAVTRSGDLIVEAVAGSVTGVLPGWTGRNGSATLTAARDVILRVDGVASIGTIAADGAVTGTGASGSGSMGAVRIDRIGGVAAGTKAASVTLTATGDLQVTEADVTGRADLSTTGGSADAVALVAPVGQLLVPGHGSANLDAAAALVVRAAVDAGEAATGPLGVAQLGTIRGARLAVTADAVDVLDARSRSGAMDLLAERGRLRLVTGDVAGVATLWKRDKDAVSGVAIDDADALFVGRLGAGAGIDARSATDATVTEATARGGNLVVQALRDVALATGTASDGSLVLAAGRDAGSLLSLDAAADVAIRAERNVTLGTIGSTARQQTRAGDDIDLFAGNRLYVADLTARGDVGRDTSGVTFTPAAFGRGNPLVAGTGGVAFTAETLPAGTVLLRATDITGPALTGSTDVGLVVETLTSGTATLTAAASDIRVGSATTNGDPATGGGALSLTATAGSVTGLATDWRPTQDGSTIKTPGQVIVAASGDVAIGRIGGLADGSSAGDVTASSDGTSRYGTVRATSLDLTGGPTLQVGSATVSGTTRLATTGGSASAAIDLTGTDLASGYTRATLDAAGVLSVRAAADAGEAATGPIGVALLGTIEGSSLSVVADAIDLTQATTTSGQLYLLAERGRLTLGTGKAATQALLWKRDKDAVAGTAASAADGLFVTALNAGSGIDARSATDATVSQAAVTDGNLGVQAARNATLTDGEAGLGTGTGSLAVLAGSGTVDSVRLVATRDVSVRAGGDARLVTVTAGDDAVLLAGGALTFTGVTARATDTGSGEIVFTPAAAGLGTVDPADPLALTGGGIAFANGSDTLAGSSVFVRAGSVGGPALGGNPGSGLVVETLTSGSATLTADLGDIRIGGADTTGSGITTTGALSVEAVQGAVTGLGSGREAGSGGSSIVAAGRTGEPRGNVTIETLGTAIIGSIVAGGTVSGGGVTSAPAGTITGAGVPAVATTSGSAAAIRLRDVRAAALALTATGDLQLGTALVDGAATLRTTGGTAQGGFALAPSRTAALDARFGRADLSAGGTLGVRAAVDAGEAATGPLGIAQLGTIRGASLAVTADAVDVTTATTTSGPLYLLAERGRLALGTGTAASQALLWKRDKDAAAGTPASTDDALFVTTLTAATGVDARSATDATVDRAIATSGDLQMQATRDATLRVGSAGGTLAVLAGGNILSDGFDATLGGSLTAGEDVALGAGGDVTLRADGSVRHVVSAGDDVDVTAGGTVFVTEAVARGTGSDAREVRFTPGAAGTGDPAVAGTGGIALVDGATLPAAARLAGSSIRLTAGAVTGPGVGTPSDDGLVIGRLDAGDAVIDAASGDIRIRDAVTRSGDLIVEAVAGSVTGVLPGWTGRNGSATLTAARDVILRVDGVASIGTIAADGAVTGTGASGSGSMGAVRIDRIGGVAAGTKAASVTLTATGDLQVTEADVTGRADLSTTGGSADAVALVAPVGQLLVPGHGSANLDAAAALVVRAAVDAGEAATGPLGVAQLGTIRGARLAVTADAVDVLDARSRSGAMDLLAERGRLRLVTGDVAGVATLWKRDKDAVSGVAIDDADALFVGRLGAGAGIDARSATDATVTEATARGGNLVVQALRDVALATGTASDGSLVLAAGRDAGSLLSLDAAADVAIRAERNVTLGTIGSTARQQTRAGDDIDLFAGNRLYVADLTARGDVGRDTSGVTFTPAAFGRGNPLVAGTGGVAFTAETLPAGTVLLRATDITGPALTGSTDVGLVVETLTSGTATLTAAASDIRVGSATTNGDPATGGGALSLTATAGSVTGLATDWRPTQDGSTIKTPGQVIVAASGDVAIGRIGGLADGSSAGDVTATSDGTSRYGTIVATSLDLTGGPTLQVGSATVSGTTRLATTGGSASGAIDLTGTDLASGYTRATLDAAGVLSVRAAADAGEAATGPIGVALLGAIEGSSLSVVADAIDLTQATTTSGQLYLLAERGRLTLGTGKAATQALLWKRDKDAVAGTATSAADGLFVTALDAGTAIDARSATDATVSQAAVTNGNLGVQAARNATLTDGEAGLGTGTGSLAVLAGSGTVDSTRLVATRDVSVRAGGDARLVTVTAGDDAVLLAGGALTFTGVTARATDTGSGEIVFTPAAAGLGTVDPADPLALTGGGIAFANGSDTLAGSSVFVRAGSVGGPALGGNPGSGLVVETLTSGSATLTADLGDIRIGGADTAGTGITTTGALSVEAVQGAVTGLGSGREAGSGGSSIVAAGRTGEPRGNVTIETLGTAVIGSIVAGGTVSAGGVTSAPAGTITGAGVPAVATTSGSAAAIRLRDVRAAALALTATGDLQLGTALVDGAATLRTTGGSAQGGFALAPSRTAALDARFGRADLSAGGTLGVRAAVDAGEAATGPLGIAQLGTIRGASLAVTADAVDVTTATTTSGPLYLLAERGRLALGTGTAATQALLWKRDKDAAAGTPAGTDDALFVTTLTAGTGVDARSATDATVDRAIATSGDLQVQATRDVALGTGQASAGTVALLAGRNAGSATSLTAAEDVAVQAVGTATLGTVTAGDDITMVAGGNLAIGSATTSGTAGRDTRAVVFTPAFAGLGNPPTANTGGIAFGAEVASPVTAQLTGANVRLETRGDIAIGGTVAVTGGSTQTIRLVNSGSGRTTAIGTSASNGFVLDDAEMDRLSAVNVIVDSSSNALTIGTLSIADVTGSTALKLLTTGTVAMSGAVTGGGATSRTLQIGGNDAGPRVSDGSNLASRIVADTGDANGGAGIRFAGTVDLRAKRLVFGTGAEFLGLVAGTNDAAAQTVSNAGSPLYLGNRTRETFLTANKLSVSYSDFALFQNTIPGISGGAALGPTGNSVTNVALQLFSTGDNRDNSFAIFGTINGFVGRAAGVLPNDVLNIADDNPRTLRVTQSNTRVNGCVIGSPDRGCLITDVPRTEFRLYDERQTQLITAADDPSLYANPLIGRGNEGLIVDIADVPVGIDTIECPKDEPNCRAPRSPK